MAIRMLSGVTMSIAVLCGIVMLQARSAEPSVQGSGVTSANALAELQATLEAKVELCKAVMRKTR